MTKEEWEGIKNSQELPLSCFHAYFVEKSGNNISLGEFEKLFPQYVQSGMMTMGKDGNIRVFSHEKAVVKIIKHFNEKYSGNTE